MPRRGVGAAPAATATNEPPSRTAFQRGDPGDRSVERAVHAVGQDLADGAAEVCRAGDELVGAQAPDQFLVTGSSGGSRPQPAQRGELERVAAERARGSRDQQPLAGPQRQQVKCLRRGEAIERDGRGLSG